MAWLKFTEYLIEQFFICFFKKMIRKTFFRCLNTKICRRSSKSSDHWYTCHEELNLSSITSIANFVQNNKIFENEHLVAFNKPTRISAYTQNQSKLSTSTESQLSIEDVLHIIAKQLNCGSLQISKAPHPSYSGAMLLAKSNKAHEAIFDSFRRIKRRDKIIRTDLALTIGTPEPATGIIKVPIEITKINNKTVSLPVFKPSKNKLKQRSTLPKRTEYKTLDVSDNVALVQLGPRDGLGQLSLLHITCKMCKVLGDKEYSNRIVDINGVRMFLDADKTKPGVYTLPKNLRHSLKLETDSQQYKNFPLFMHRWKLTLPQSTDLNLPNGMVITAPLPEYYSTALKLLNLYLPNSSAK